MNKIKTKKGKWVLAVVLMIGMTPLFVHAINAWDYSTSDSIDKAKIDTQHILERFEKTKDADEIRSWITHGPTEALGTQVNLTFGEWALEHPNGFISIVEGLPSKEQVKFADFFCASLNQTSLDAEFKAKFRGSKSKAVLNMLKML